METSVFRGPFSAIGRGRLGDGRGRLRHGRGEVLEQLPDLAVRGGGLPSGETNMAMENGPYMVVS